MSILQDGEKTEINTDMSVFYYKLTNNGKKVFEVDALNQKIEDATAAVEDAYMSVSVEDLKNNESMEDILWLKELVF